MGGDRGKRGSVSRSGFGHRPRSLTAPQAPAAVLVPGVLLAEVIALPAGLVARRPLGGGDNVPPRGGHYGTRERAIRQRTTVAVWGGCWILTSESPQHIGGLSNK